MAISLVPEFQVFQFRGKATIVDDGGEAAGPRFALRWWLFFMLHFPDSCALYLVDLSSIIVDFPSYVFIFSAIVEEYFIWCIPFTIWSSDCL